VAGRLGQGDEDLGLGLLDLGDGGADDALAALVAQGAEAVIDAAGGVPLPGRGVLVVVQDLGDDGQERVEDRLGARPGEIGPGLGLGLVDDLSDGAEVEVVLGGGLAQAQLAGADATTDLGPKFHVGEHSCASRGLECETPQR
jgi:hypothetical protein